MQGHVGIGGSQCRGLRTFAGGEVPWESFGL